MQSYVETSTIGFLHCVVVSLKKYIIVLRLLKFAETSLHALKSDELR